MGLWDSSGEREAHLKAANIVPANRGSNAPHHLCGPFWSLFRWGARPGPTVGTVQPLPDGDKFCLRRGVEKMASNKLYLAVLPMVHLAANQYGLTEQVITLLPGREHATEFFPDEVNEYISIFDRRLKLLPST